ncbi:DNA ligase D [Glaciimonas immobilis]|uniref:DNA ligase (ATP) n=1 Tax=Glaciimonas immobilis TaxID=728004 RepID=A0A840RW96_9BURK|nr:DNA ligase D [Glaciimonas immobilis]KAF3996323.1 DNA ligase D [Glaciimonas immobilis]MBB5202155.1 bifunctional non-homologous end joining protein LigD [Glaciimonas immobilis]
MTRPDPLRTYKNKRDFSKTSEPEEGGLASPEGLVFVVQKHWASHLHYDVRLEFEGTMRSWAVPKGPSYDPKVKRMAVQVEDHPIAYNAFEGEIPAKQYGAGKVIIWDKGTWEPIADPAVGLRDGNLKFVLHGFKLRGKWALIRIKNKNGAEDKTSSEHKPTWLLIKEKDAFAQPSAAYNVVDEMPDSVAKLSLPSTIVAPKTSIANGADSEPANAEVKGNVRKSVKKKIAAPASSALSVEDGTIPAGAIEAPLPAELTPQLATLVDSPPRDSEEWLYEIKYDGYRLLSRIEGNNILLITRNGNDWSQKLPALADALRKAQLPNGWYDGEIVMPGEKGIPDFQALQGAFDTKKTQEIVYFLFDLPFFSGFDLRPVPLVARRSVLKFLLEKSTSPTIRFSDTFEALGRDIVTSACSLGMEGVIGKKKDAPYVGRRSADWIKLKCSQRQEFVIGGYTDPQGRRTGLGSLLLGVHDADGKLRYAGKVGTGFDDKTLRSLTAALSAIGCAESPFTAASDLRPVGHWVQPRLLAEVSFSEWTKSGRIRHPVFHGLRTDKPARAIVREVATHLSAPEDRVTSLPAWLKITSPEREIDPESGTTKIELLRFYALVGPLMMPHLKGRPVSLVRAPDGVGKQLFFQKHLALGELAGVAQLAASLYPDHERLLEVVKPEGLLSAAQMNVMEFHTWNAIKTAINKPDRMTFDLDPGEGVEWQMMQESALLVKALMDQLGLTSFVKTSGGKGFHIVVPVAKHFGWNQIKAFSRAIVAQLVLALPSHFVVKSGPRNRVGKIFVDYLRNGFGATTVCAWSARARPGLGVSVPLAWDEVPKVNSGAHWTVSSIHTRLDQGNGPWEGYADAAQGLAGAMKKLGFNPEREG